MPSGIKVVRTRAPEFFSRHKKLWSVIGIAVVSSYLLYSFIFSNLGVVKYLSMKSNYKQIRAEISGLKKDNSLIREDIDSLKTDPDYIEGMAREKLGLVKEGEIIYRFLDENKK